VDSVNIPTSVVTPNPMLQPLTSQTNSQQQSDSSAKQAEQFEVDKETRMIAELSRQKAAAQAESSTQKQPVAGTERQGNVVSKTSSDPRMSSLSSSRAPNWSQLSAAVNGYTHLQRAMNLYQQIDRL